MNTRQWFGTQGVVPMEWQAQCHDLNPIQHLCGTLSEVIKNRTISNKVSLSQRFGEEWSTIAPSACKEVVDLMINRIKWVFSYLCT